MKNRANSIYVRLISPNRLIGASILRILLGIIIIYNYIINYSLRHFFWHDSGVISDNIFNSIYKLSFSPYSLTESIIYFEVIFHLGLFTAILFTVGFGGKFIQILNYIFTISLINRNVLISDGGDNILSLCLLYMLFMNVTEYFSIKLKPQWSFPKFLPETRAIIHNFAVIFVVCQICIMYFLSGIFQIMGEKWNNGTAIYYILQVDTFSKPFWEQILSSSDYLIVFFTYASILVKLAFPFLLINKWSKYFIVCLIMMFHAGIGIAMGLITFSATMIAIETLLFSDKEYKILYSFTKNNRFVNKFFIKRGKKLVVSLDKEVG